MKKHGEESLNITTIGYLQSISDVNIDQNENPYIYLKLLSIPQSMYEKVEKSRTDEKIQVYLTAFKDESIDNEFMSSFERRKEIYNHLKEKVISTQLQMKYFENGNEILRGQNAKILNDFDDNDKYFDRIPVFSPENTNTNIKNHKDFEANLIAGYPLGSLLEFWSKYDKDIPTYLFWENKDESFVYKIESDEYTQNQYNNLNVIDINPLDIKAKSITLDKIITKYKLNDILFIPNKNMEDIEFGEPFNNEYIEELQNYLSDEDEPEKDIEINNNEKNYNINNDNKELKFIKRFKDITIQKGLHYNMKDLINFHTAIKSDGLVILAGLSGTGKSQLITAYANALDPQNSGSENINFISVRPFWNDDADLLGYVDTMNSVYRPGESGLLETIMLANKNPKSIYIVVFDEMNLAKVEHYFSQFLSILEMDKN